MSEIKNPRVICIVPNFVAASKESQNRWLIKGLLKSFVEHEQNIDIHIIDDGSKTINESYYYQFSDIVRGTSINLSFEMSNINQGFAKTVNVGIKRAVAEGYDYCVLINSDIELMMPFQAEMINKFQSIPKIRVWGPRLLFPDGNIQSAGIGISKDLDIVQYCKDIPSLSNTHNSLESKFVNAVTGAFLAIRLPTEDFLDEDFFMAYEDLDYCLKTWKKGEFVFYDANVDAIHHEGATRGAGLSLNELNSRELFKSKKDSYNLVKTSIIIKAANMQLLNRQGGEQHARQVETREENS